MLLRIFYFFAIKLKYPPSQIATQSIGPEIINLKDSIGIDKKVQQNLSHFDKQTHPEAQPYNLLGLPQFWKEAKQLKNQWRQQKDIGQILNKNLDQLDPRSNLSNIDKGIKRNQENHYSAKVLDTWRLHSRLWNLRNKAQDAEHQEIEPAYSY